MRVWTLCLSALAVLGCAPVTDPQLPPGGVPVDNTEQLLRGQYSGFSQRARLVIRDAEAWSQFWNQAHGNVMPRPPVPSIDFAHNIVVAATMGSRSNGGHTIEIDRVYAADDGLHVVVEERSPGAGCVTTAAITAPAAAQRIPRPGASVSFVERSETFTC